MELVRYNGHPTTLAPFANVIFLMIIVNGAFFLLSRVTRLSFLQPLSPAENLAFYILASIVTAWVGHDSIQVLMPQIIYPFRYESPENRWRELFLDFLPRWLYVSDRTALRHAYEGGHDFWKHENLNPWLVPLLAWGTFAFFLGLFMMGLSLFVFHRWTNEERLSYPILFLPLEISRRPNRLWTSTPFLLGFLLATSLDLLNGFSALYPSVPSVKVRVTDYDRLLPLFFVGHPWSALQGTRMGFYPFAVGLGFLLPPELLLSCWFFYWAERLQRVLGLIVGWSQLPGYPWTNFQAFGGYVGITLFSLWAGRQSWLDILTKKSKAFRVGRVGAVLIVLSGAFLVFFARAMGMSFNVGIAFFGIYFLLVFSILRIRAELGPPAHDLHYAGPDEVLINLFGPQGLAKRDLVVAKLFYWWNRAYRSLPGPHFLEGLKVGSLFSFRISSWVTGMLFFSGVGIAAAMIAHLYCFYSLGITAKFVGPAITAFGGEPFWRLQGLLAAPPSPNPYPPYAMAAGILFTLTLMALRIRFPWFPLHPVGYAISTSWSMNVLWMPLFLSYLIKMGVVRIGGYQAFRHSLLPFGIGLVLGEFLVGNLWLLYGVATGKNTYPYWV